MDPGEVKIRSDGEKAAAVTASTPTTATNSTTNLITPRGAAAANNKAAPESLPPIQPPTLAALPSSGLPPPPPLPPPPRDRPQVPSKQGLYFSWCFLDLQKATFVLHLFKRNMCSLSVSLVLICCSPTSCFSNLYSLHSMFWLLLFLELH